MKSNRRNASGAGDRIKELEAENAKLRSKLAKQEEDQEKGAWIEERISRGLTFMRSKVSLPENSGLVYQYARMLLCISLLTSEEDRQRRVELQEFTLNELMKLYKSWMDENERFWNEVKRIINQP
jgi:hypothetical protein